MEPSLKIICDNYRHEGGTNIIICLKAVFEYIKKNGPLLGKFDDEVNMDNLDPLVKETIKEIILLMRDGYYSNYFDLYSNSTKYGRNNRNA